MTSKVLKHSEPRRSKEQRLKTKLKEKLLEISEGFLANLTDVILLQLFFGVNLVGKMPTSRGAWQAFCAAQEDLEDVNYEKFRRAFYILRKKGLIRTFQEEALRIQVTQKGKERLVAQFPFYQKERPWGGKIYLITYDIPETCRSKRDLLREQLQKLGCGFLQASVWVSPYDWREILREFAEEKKLRGMILVSDVGEDGSIGGMNIPEIINEVYNIEAVNSYYKEFIEKYKKQKGDVSQWELNFDWFVCLEHDPQLPFELLPKNFLGDKAYQLYKKLVLTTMEGLANEFIENKIKQQALEEKEEKLRIRVYQERQRSLRQKHRKL